MRSLQCPHRIPPPPGPDRCQWTISKLARLQGRYAHGMICTVREIRFHDRGCELDLQPVAADAQPFMAKGSVDIAIDAALHLQPGDRVRIEGDPWSHSRPWTMLSRLEKA